MSEQEVNQLTVVNQAMTPEDFGRNRKELLKFVASQLKETKTGTNGDYGVIPYVGKGKKSLLKPGAEKLAKLFGLSIAYEKIKEIEDFEKGFIFYKYKCTLTHFVTGKFVGDAIRQSNSKEKSFGGESVYECANKVEAKAQKRALVAAIVQATNASDIFDADTSDFEEEAPNKSTTAEEDPRRNRLMAKLYATASAHGWTDAWIHTAVTKKWEVESLTNLSNEQIEFLTEFILEKYVEVGKGNKPQLREAVTVNSSNETAKGVEVTNPESQERIEADIVDTEDKQVKHCRNTKKHGDEEVVVPEGSDPDWFCDKACQDEYWGEDVKKKSRLEEFIEEGKKKKAAEEAVVA